MPVKPVPDGYRTVTPSLREPADQFHGDRSGGVKDPCGNQWWCSTHVEDVPPGGLERRMKAPAR